MLTLAATPETIARAKSSLKSCAFSYCGPDTLRDGTDIHDALDRVIRSLSDCPPAKVAKLTFLQVNPADVFAAAAALPSDHWLRRFWERGGFLLSAPAPRKMAFGH